LGHRARDETEHPAGRTCPNSSGQRSRCRPRSPPTCPPTDRAQRQEAGCLESRQLRLPVPLARNGSQRNSPRPLGRSRRDRRAVLSGADRRLPAGARRNWLTYWAVVAYWTIRSPRLTIWAATQQAVATTYLIWSQTTLQFGSISVVHIH